MPALAFGLKSNGPTAKAPAKRKAMFDEEDEPANSPPQSALKKSSKPLKPLQPLHDDSSDSDNDKPTSTRPQKSPKLSHQTPTYGLQKKEPAKDYTNLSALRTAQLHNQQASQLDSSVYDYDNVYDTFRPATSTKSSSAQNDTSSGPRYMGALLASTNQRKRDHERAREKAIQRERAAEGDEFADKEAFVTSAYKKQQEESRVAEEEERQRLEEEEERRKKGVGMLDFNKRMLEREEERMKAIAEAAERAKKNGDGDAGAVDEAPDTTQPGKGEGEQTQKKGVIVNEEGEVIDKRQLLSAGLNVAPKKPSSLAQPAKAAKQAADRSAQSSRPNSDARLSQRERQSRMIERQMEAMAEQQAAEEAKEVKEQEEKNRSRITEDAKMSAKERYLARKREREAEKQGGGG